MSEQLKAELRQFSIALQQANADYPALRAENEALKEQLTKAQNSDQHNFDRWQSMKQQVEQGKRGRYTCFNRRPIESSP